MTAGSPMRASCTCTAPVMVRAGAVVCATCGAPIVSSARDVEPDVYTTARDGALPAGRSRRWLREHARSIPGSTREGGTRGRSVVWRVSRDAYRAWLDAMTIATVEPPAIGVMSDEQIDACISASGYRTTRPLRSIKGGRS